MVDWLVTANLGGSFAPEAVKQAGIAWAQKVIGILPAIVFAQAVPSQRWLELWRDAGYRVALSDAREWQVRSAVISRADLKVTGVTARQFPTLAYHGSYVAAVSLASTKGEVLLASVHASPNPADPRADGWPDELPPPRTGGGDPRHPGGGLWDSDLLLRTLAVMAAKGPLVAGGDFNEARGLDLAEGGTRVGTWGQEYFDTATKLGLEAWPAAAWGEERPTQGRFQLSHVFISARTLGFLLGDPMPHFDEDWPEMDTTARSAHAPMWIGLDPGWL
jgi:hypothetical protein